MSASLADTDSGGSGALLPADQADPSQSDAAASAPPAAPPDLPDLLPARMLNEFVYCPRLFYLE
ncbi:MAG: hypothetical protein AB1716_03260, partial [Planctomycetota bacterium]